MKTKAYSFLSFFLLIGMLSACHDDEQEVMSVVGRWQGTSLSASFTPDGIPASIDQDDDTFDAVLEFKEDGSVIYSDDSDFVEGTWEQNGKFLNLTLSENVYSIDLSGECTLEKINETNLVIYVKRAGAFDIPDYGILEGTIEARLYFDAIP